MIAIDTNVVVRLLVADDPTKAQVARQLVEQAARRADLVLITDIVLCELEWVLDSAYKVPRAQIALAIQTIAADERFCFENDSRAQAALELYVSGRGDLSENLLGLGAEQVGATTTFTFDRALRGEALFSLLRA
jgi:predicted nucleic-acid-binding protein